MDYILFVSTHDGVDDVDLQYFKKSKKQPF
jgi:hypothetical protein